MRTDSSDYLKFASGTWPGVLIVFCGLDGSGKTTLLTMLRDELTALGAKVMVTKQPTDAVRQSPLFQRVMYSSNFEAEIEYRSHSLITVSDRVQHSLRVILPALRKGQIVVSDRYFFAAIANLRARGYREDRWIYEIGNFLPRPDAAVFCEPPFELILQRLSAREHERGRYFDVDFNKTLYEEFVFVRQHYDEPIVMNTSGAPETTYQQLRSKIEPVIFRKLGIQLG
jgi:dTMP kinase